MDIKTSKETTVSVGGSASSEPQRSGERTGERAGEHSSASGERGYEGRSRDRDYGRDRDDDRDRYYSRDRNDDRDRYYSRDRDYDRYRDRDDRDRDRDRSYSSGVDDDRSGGDSRDGRYSTRSVWREAPLVIEVDDRDRGSRGRYSRGFRDAQLSERDMTRGMERIAAAVADGLAVYRDARDRSADRERDGAIRDFFSNVGEGMSETMRRGSRAPRDFTRESPVTTERFSREIQRMVRPFIRMYFR